MISDKTDTNCNEARGVDGVYMSISLAEGIEHDSVSVEKQALLGRQSVTATLQNDVRERSCGNARRKRNKNKWTKEENRKVWECYLRSKPEERGYRKRMHALWKVEGMKEVREQQLCDQRRHIEEKHWLEELEN